MIILSWLFLLGVTLYTTFVNVDGIILENGFSVRTAISWVIPVTICGILWYSLVVNFPFVIAVQ